MRYKVGDEYPVWWDTNYGRPIGHHKARIIEIFKYTGAYPQFFNYVFKLYDPNTSRGWSEMAVKV